ncbi:MAG TPA: TonB C-terminal domain-containing protein [Candidatus Babeliales bacterium]|nr:TonB C-terminal domain-containing protein [Candidatus Babeliales bacterium]
MSLLQRKNIHKRHLLWVKLFGICLFFHIIFLWWIFCIYRDNSYVLSLSVHKNFDYSAPIMFVPLHSSSAAKTAKDTVIITPKKQIIPIPKAAHTPSKSEVKKPTTVAAVNTPSPKKVPDIKKVEAAKPVIAPIKEPVKEIAKNEIKKECPTENNIAKALDIEQKITPVIPENAQVSDNYRHVEALRMQAQLQKEIVQTWKPPIGVSPDCSCDVSFFVTTTGTLNHIKMVQPSGVMMFDISARQALCATKMPHWTYGKTITITFKQ